MSKIITVEDVERLQPGESLVVAKGIVVTPLALDLAKEKNITIAWPGQGQGQGQGKSENVRQEPPRERNLRSRVEDLAGTKLGPDISLVDMVVEEVMATLGRAQEPSPLPEPLPEPSPEPSPAPHRRPDGMTDLTQCLHCNDSRDGKNRAVITAMGRNQSGIMAAISAVIAARGGDVIEVSQTLVGGFFTMILIVDLGKVEAMGVTFLEFRDAVEQAGGDVGVKVVVMHEEILNAMHRI